MTFFASTYRQLRGSRRRRCRIRSPSPGSIDPAIVRCVEANVVVETKGEWTSGATAVDLFHYTGRAPNAQVAVELDREAFWTRIVDAVTALG